jgi:hypothetical protein
MEALGQMSSGGSASQQIPMKIETGVCLPSELTQSSISRLHLEGIKILASPKITRESIQLKPSIAIVSQKASLSETTKNVSILEGNIDVITIKTEKTANFTQREKWDVDDLCWVYIEGEYELGRIVKTNYQVNKIHQFYTVELPSSRKRIHCDNWELLKRESEPMGTKYFVSTDLLVDVN